MNKNLILSVLLVMILFFISATTTNAYSFNTRNWPKKPLQPYTVTLQYTTTNSTYKSTFTTAVSDWNSAQSKIKYVLTDNIAPNKVGTENVDDPSLYGTCYALNGSSLYFNAVINIGNPQIVNNSLTRRSAAVHELGHGIGLGHETPPVLSVMNSQRDRTKVYIPQQDDIQGVNMKYPY
ncbi:MULTISPECIES: matrixin family metalloprotease [unclassified Sporosarcina]|uniref:matrixin family metalloprotease n=1 Tax=unclassified Sporosarcina TaxID=2647733 RepID=UPI0016447E33|nr:MULTISPECIES: matrixin family metalloprotease [unclassified Sporosarcina]MBO0589615.1 matrixin family metalloprotease [Sporosarcina sp. E16_8]MBO0603514.1 matrixin family metalloprotease [Sporosarcina sp. E16_3]